jgi:hypothetical protein
LLDYENKDRDYTKEPEGSYEVYYNETEGVDQGIVYGVDEGKTEQ